MKKRINRRLNTWRNGCFRKMGDHLVHTTPNHLRPKMDNLPKTFLQTIRASKWLVRHSCTYDYTSPKQQQRPLPCFLASSSSSTVTHLVQTGLLVREGVESRLLSQQPSNHTLLLQDCLKIVIFIS